MKKIDKDLYEHNGKKYRVVESTDKIPGTQSFKTCSLCVFGDSDRYPSGCKADKQVHGACMIISNASSRMRDYGYFVEVANEMS